MEIEIINGHDLMNMLETSLARLADQSKDIDALNVFPVPDGDTGTNMHLTLASAVREAQRAADGSSIGLVAEAASRGALMGARGNSGVILSQLLRGTALGLKNMDRVTGAVFAGALEEGVRVAYRAMMKPVEGTILTVAREAAKGAVTKGNRKATVWQIMQAACQSGEKALRQTTGMLPALREAGVVDAGGKGWLVILEGLRDGWAQKEPGVAGGYAPDMPAGTVGKEQGRVWPGIAKTKQLRGKGLKFPYCTEVVVKGDGIDHQSLRDTLQDLGDCLMVVGTEGFVRVHIHSANPGTVLEKCLLYGPLTDIRVSNMEEQSEEAGINTNAKESGDKPYGIVAVATGDGIRRIMENAGADRVVAGGQTMNPSAEELVGAVENLAAEEVIILPNNSNIIMTARQVGELTAKKVTVVPSRSVIQGLAALLAIRPGADVHTTAGDMERAMAGVKTGEITYAVRDTKIDGQEIKKGSLIGLFDGRIACTGEKMPELAVDLLKEMIGDGNEVCTLYYGEAVDVTEAEGLLSLLEETFPHLEFELYSGGQPLYYYFISVE